MYKFVTVLVLALMTLSSAVSAELSADEQAVWNLEVDYWNYVQKNDVESYRALWDERFIGWPGFSPTTMDKSRIDEWFAPYHEDPTRRFEYELKMESVRSYGSEIVVAHYLAQGKFVSVDSGEELPGGYYARLTHTWQRRGDGWVIITGMSGDWIGEDAN